LWMNDAAKDCGRAFKLLHDPVDAPSQSNHTTLFPGGQREFPHLPRYPASINLHRRREVVIRKRCVCVFFSSCRGIQPKFSLLFFFWLKRVPCHVARSHSKISVLNWYTDDSVVTVMTAQIWRGQ
jgi:hypothetical protein